MKFRPCIDIHNGQVKQIVGGTLADKNNYAEENFVSRQDGAYYGRLYKGRGLTEDILFCSIPKAQNIIKPTAFRRIRRWKR